VLGEGQEMSRRTLEAEAIAERADDDGRRSRVWAFLTTVHARLGELDEALGKGVRAVEIAERLGDLRLLIPASSCLAQVLYHLADHERVAALVSSSLARFPDDLVQEDFGMPAQASILLRYWPVMSLAELGRFAEASRHAADSIQAAEARQDAGSMTTAHFAAGTLQSLKGDATRQAVPFERRIAIARAGQPSMVGHTVAYSALELALRGEASLALDQIVEGEQLLEEQVRKGPIFPTGQAFRSLGRAYLLLGRLDQARALAARARETSSRYPGWAAHAEQLLGDVAAHPDDFDAGRGEIHYRQALAVAEPRGMRPLVAHCHLGLGKLSRRTGKSEQAREHLTIATTMYGEMGMAYWLEQAEAEMGA
jgi:tetratricopeptide (TPR) repeat protein